MEARVEELDRESAGLKQRNRNLLRSAFGKRSEKRQSTDEGEAAGAQPPAAQRAIEAPAGTLRG